METRPRAGQRVVAFRRALVEPAGGVLPALFLSQAVYWQLHYGEDRWWSRTRQDWLDELGMTRRQQETCREALRDAGLLEERLAGMPRRVEYRVAMRKLKNFQLGGNVPTSGTNQPDNRAEPAQQVGTNQPNHLCEIPDKISKTEPPPDHLPGAGVSPPRAPLRAPLPGSGGLGPKPGKRPPRAARGPSLTDVVNGLREVYPHPTNRGAPRRRPNPMAIEQWLADRVRMGQLTPDQYPLILAAAERERRMAEADPERFRRALRTWIREAGWTDEVEEEDTGPAVPPPSTGPRFTPEGWTKPKR